VTANAIEAAPDCPLLGRPEATLLFHAQELADVAALDSPGFVGAIVGVR
jgi:hypothetical protein